MNAVTQERYGIGTCKHRISELSMFFDWLHVTDEFDWRKPEEYDSVSRTIARDKTKRSIRKLVAKPLFSVEDLARINAQCMPIERVLLYLGLNCAFGAAESGRLNIWSTDDTGTGDLYLHQPHPLAYLWEKQGFRSAEADSWIAYLRPKTGVAGTWWLWPETVAAIEAWLAVRPPTDSPRLIVNSKGFNLYSETSRNGQSTFTNLWGRLLGRVNRANPSLPPLSLPFGTLRAQFPDWAVQHDESVSGSIALAHGSPYKDDLLACYSNRPFPRLFEVQKRYREFLSPVLAVT